MLSHKDFDDVYFGARRPHYSNYLESATNWKAKEFIEQFIKKHGIGPNDKVLELGAGIGFNGKISEKLGINWLCVDFAPWCFENRQTDHFKLEDALVFIKTQMSQSYDYVVGFGFLECLTDSQLIELKEEVQSVGTHCIFYVYQGGNPADYNMKTLDEWKAILGPDIVMEWYDGEKTKRKRSKKTE